jgi:hypothetical protein
MKERKDRRPGMILRRPYHGRVKNVIEQVVKVPEQDNPKGTSQLVPILLSGGEFCPAPLIRRITEFKDLMDKKREQVQDKKVHRKIPLPMSIVVLDMVALVF